MTQAEKITCTRCRGTGLFTDRVMYAGVNGGCFKCSAKGWVYKDKFLQTWGVGKKFIGITTTTWYNEGNPNNGIKKSIGTADRFETDDLKVGAPFAHSSGTYAAVEITEEQARKFWAKYGDTPVQVSGDFDPLEVFPADHPVAIRRLHALAWKARVAARTEAQAAD